MVDNDPQISSEARAALEGYLEVLSIAAQGNFAWTARDIHAAFEWANVLGRISGIPEIVPSLNQAAKVCFHQSRPSGWAVINLIPTPGS